MKGNRAVHYCLGLFLECYLLLWLYWHGQSVPSPSISNFSGGTVDVSKWLSKRLCQVTIRCKPILSHVSEGTYLIVHKAKIRAPPHMPTSIAICRRGTRPTYIMRNTLPHNNTAVERFSVMISMQVIPVTHSISI